ncbi:reverse transcriptase domain-containing protein [Tanacetum coccineum]
MPREAGARLILINPKGIEFTYALRFEFEASNNEAESEILGSKSNEIRILLVDNAQSRSECLGYQERSYPTTKSSLGITHSRTGVSSSTSSKGGDNKNWVEVLPHVLWAHCTEIKSSNGHTSFFLTYGTEAVIPLEIGMPSLMCEKVDQAMNDEALILNLDILEEMQEKAAIQEARSKAKMEKYYNAKVRNTKISCTAVMKQAMQKKEESSTQNGRARTR